MNFQDLQNRISGYYATLDFPETKNSFDNLKNIIINKLTNELKDLIINSEFTFTSFDEELNIIKVDEIKSINKIIVNGLSYPIEEKIQYIIKTSWFEGNTENKINKTIINELKTLNQGDKINVNLKFSDIYCCFEKPLPYDEKTLNLSLSFVLKSFEIIHKIELQKIELQKINLFQLKEKISNYCNQFDIPKNSTEFIDFKKVFDHNWKKEKETILFEDNLTFKKPDFDFLNNFYDFIETQYKVSNRYTVNFIFHFSSHLMNNELKDGDKVILISKIISIETNRLEIYYGMTQPIIEINFQINSLEIVEKFDEEFDEEFEIKKLEEKILKKEEKNNEIIIDRINVFNSGVNETNQTSKIKSFKDFLNISLEGSYLQRQSYQTKSGLNSFQNKVFNEKKLEEYNTKKKRNRKLYRIRV